LENIKLRKFNKDETKTYIRVVAIKADLNYIRFAIITSATSEIIVIIIRRDNNTSSNSCIVVNKGIKRAIIDFVYNRKSYVVSLTNTRVTCKTKYR